MRAHRAAPATGAATLALIVGLALLGADSGHPARAALIPGDRPQVPVGTTATGTVAPPSFTEELPTFSYSIKRIGPARAERMGHTWRPGCPIGLGRLRFLRMTYYGFDKEAHQGRMVVRRRWAEPVVEVFHTAYDARFPIRRMWLVDRYEGSDARSMDANNTSGFNCRLAQGSSHWSQHAYGAAIDVNPVQNPYIKGSIVLPAAGKDYVERTPRRKGMVTRKVRRAFSDIGWSWGGNFQTLKDYQHFSASG